jgi:PIN domain nuclease of toxin-antitoxin system
VTKKSLPPLLLDTHAWIWLATGTAGKFKPDLLRKLEDAAQSDMLRLSAITPWEIAVLHRKKRLRLSADPLDWVRSTMRLTRVQLVPLTPEIALESERLPELFHGDPADRIIVASAIATNSILVTADRRILKFSNAGQVETLACG